jgi:hypothetical protein
MTESSLTNNGLVGPADRLRPLSGNPWTPPEDHSNRESEAYPFRNFWSVEGGLDEVLFALPSRDRAELLVMSFFKYVDPLYPVVPENLFRSRFEEFWALAPSERYGVLCYRPI